MTVIDDVSPSRTSTEEDRAKPLAWYEKVRKSSPIRVIKIDSGPMGDWLDKLDESDGNSA